MSITLISLKCPSCGASLSTQKSREFMYCEYCGEKILLNNENEYIFRSIDEARIKEAEVNRDVRLRELDVEEKTNKQGRKGTPLFLLTFIIVILIGGYLCSMGGETGEAGFMIMLFSLLFASFFLLINSLSGGKNYSRTTKTPGSNEVEISETIEENIHKKYYNVVLIFQKAGFSNVNAIPLNDLSPFEKDDVDWVDEVSIDGITDFEEGDRFPKDAEVNIRYHSKTCQ